MQTEILVNGEYSDVVQSDDRGLQYGDGLFETIAIVDGTPLLWDAHAQRLQQACLKLDIACPSVSLLYRETLQLASNAERAVIKIVITRGSGGRGYAPPEVAIPRRIISLHPWPAYAPENYTQGVCVALCDTRLSSNPALAGIKHLNRLEQVLARAELSRAENLAEGIMLAQDGRIIEGTMTNLFLVNNEKVSTPVIRDCGISGIMRAELIQLMASLQIDCQQLDLSQQALVDADEIILCNSIAGIWPVSRLHADGIHDFQVGPVYTRLRDSVKKSASAWMP